MAVGRRWPMTDLQRERVVQQLIYTLENSDDDRARVAAAKVLGELDKLNMEEDRPDTASGQVTVRLVYDQHKPLILPSPQS